MKMKYILNCLTMFLYSLLLVVKFSSFHTDAKDFNTNKSILTSILTVALWNSQ